MPKPDYDGGGLVNLMASVRAGLGGDPGGYAALQLLSPARIAEARTTVVLLIDGLGADYFERHSERLRAHLAGAMTSVFPTATAPAITTLLTGTAPQQHAVTAWHMYLRELGSVVAILPFRARAGVPLGGTVPVQPLVGAGPLETQLGVEATLISPLTISDSAFNTALGGQARRVPFYDTADCFRVLEREILEGQVARGARRYIYAYWSGLDTVSHVYGSESDYARAHLHELETHIAALIEALAGSDTLLLVTADHGFIDLTDDDVHRLEHHPALAECLAAPLCGEPRAVFCHVRAGHEARFERELSRELGKYLDCKRPAELLDDGWFGRGEPDPRLLERLGDYVLIGKGHHVLYDTLQHQRPLRHIGMHGGTTREEMYVPLIIAEC